MATKKIIKKTHKYQFSVLMAVCNKEKPEYLKECLDSLFAQTIIPDEVIVVLDGKLNKNSMSILNQYDITIIKNNKPIGLSQALNKGLKKCKYELVARMDSDDICLPNRFEIQLKEFEKNKDLVLLGGQIIEFNNNHDLKKRKVPLSRDEIIKFSKKRNPFNHMTVMFKKSIVEKLNYYPILPYFEDYYLWLKIINNNYLVMNVDDILVKARTGINHIKRRGELKYIKHIYRFEKIIYKERYINFFRFISNICIRTFASILPNRVRSRFYNRFLRK